MSSGRLTHAIVRALDFLAARILPPDPRPPHHQLGTRGEEEAYFHLRRLGYQIVTRNYRSPTCRGEIDLIAWDRRVLCFIEVKTRATREVKPPEAAVDYHKRREMAEVAHEYLRHIPPSCQWRFDVVSVYWESLTASPQIDVFRGTSLAA